MVAPNLRGRGGRDGDERRPEDSPSTPRAALATDGLRQKPHAKGYGRARRIGPWRALRFVGGGMSPFGDKTDTTSSRVDESRGAIAHPRGQTPKTVRTKISARARSCGSAPGGVPPRVSVARSPVAR